MDIIAHEKFFTNEIFPDCSSYIVILGCIAICCVLEIRHAPTTCFVPRHCFCLWHVHLFVCRSVRPEVTNYSHEIAKIIDSVINDIYFIFN